MLLELPGDKETAKTGNPLFACVEVLAHLPEAELFCVEQKSRGTGTLSHSDSKVEK